MRTFSHPDQVNLQFRRGVDEAVIELSTQLSEALSNREAMELLGRQVFTRVKASYPEAKGSIGRHQDGELFQLTIYASSTDWDLDALVSDIAGADELKQLHLILILQDLEALKEG